MSEPFDCQACGACCCSQVVLKVGDAVPSNMVTPNGYCMRSGVDSRCVALRGQLGANVRCAIYDMRPEICHEVSVGDPMCLAARARLGLPGGAVHPLVANDIVKTFLKR